LVEIEAQTVKTQMEMGNILLVDVREPAEFAAEHIPGVHLMPLSSFDPAKVPEVSGKCFVLHCQSDNRSAQAGRALLAAGWETVCHLQGGLQAWKAAGFPTEHSARASISLQRQVQITAGSLVLLGTVLGAFVSPWFLLLSGFVGVGLTFAGITDTCGMALLLAKLPYNQRV
jgi:rhodanese-related sulfurtransferase